MTTILLDVQQFGKSKAVLEQALNTTPERVDFADPTPFGTNRFWGSSIPNGSKFPVVMDHPIRRRFSTIERRKDGTFKVR